MIEPNPSFGSQLGQALGGGIGQGLHQQMVQMFEQKQRQKQLSGLTPILKQLGLPDQGIKELTDSGLDPKDVLSFASHVAPIYAKAQEEKNAASLEKQGTEDVVNQMVDLLETGTLGKANAMNQLFAYGRHNRALYDELALNIEKNLVQMVGKGTLQKNRFDYLRKLLPSSNNTDATNRGKLQAIAKEFKINIANPEFWRKVGGYTGKTQESVSQDIGQQNRPPIEDIFK